MTMPFVCPDCRQPLVGDHCPACNLTFERRAGIPVLLPGARAPQLEAAAEIGAVYDDIYEHRTSVWEDQGRTPEFIRYFADLVAGLSTGRLLEIGCGEGILLATLRAEEKVAVDLSATALVRAHERTGAACAVGLAEKLPLPDDAFDVAVSVGVMEHFLDADGATREIARILRPGGYYVALIHVAVSRRQEALQKVREYIFPVPRPLALARWLLSKVYRPIIQPIQHGFTVASGRECIARNGFNVLRSITRESDRAAPLVGPHVVIYVASKA